MALLSSPLANLFEEHKRNQPNLSHHHHLALQVQHNLQHQHFWTELELHTHSPIEPDVLLPRPLIAGLPPQRLYIHPDEQIEKLQNDMFPPEREWVLPVELKEKWSLSKTASIFEGIGPVPPSLSNSEDNQEDSVDLKWRQVKRVLLAIADEDSTVVYYIVHDGIVKPRQN